MINEVLKLVEQAVLLIVTIFLPWIRGDFRRVRRDASVFATGLQIRG